MSKVNATIYEAAYIVFFVAANYAGFLSLGNSFGHCEGSLGSETVVACSRLGAGTGLVAAAFTVKDYVGFQQAGLSLEGLEGYLGGFSCPVTDHEGSGIGRKGAAAGGFKHCKRFAVLAVAVITGFETDADDLPACRSGKGNDSLLVNLGSILIGLDQCSGALVLADSDLNSACIRGTEAGAVSIICSGCPGLSGVQFNSGSLCPVNFHGLYGTGLGFGASAVATLAVEAVEVGCALGCGFGNHLTGTCYDIFLERTIDDDFIT